MKTPGSPSEGDEVRLRSPHFGRRFEGFLKDLRNAGLREDDVDRIAEAGRKFSERFHAEPGDAERVWNFARDEAAGSAGDEQRIAAMLGIWAVWEDPDNRVGFGDLVRGIVEFDVDPASKYMQQTFRKKPKATHWLERGAEILSMKAVREWLGPTAFIVLIVITFLENPMYKLGTSMLATRERSERSVSGSVDDARAQTLDSVVEVVRRASPSAAGSNEPPASLEELLARVPPDEREEYDWLRNWSLELVHRYSATGGIPVWVFRGPPQDPGVMVIEPAVSSYITPSSAVRSGGYR